MTREQILKSLYLTDADLQGGTLRVCSPIDGAVLANLVEDTESTVAKKVDIAEQAFREWQLVPAPKRGELVRLLGEELRNHKDALGALVSLEMGKILQEGLGEVQEMIDICDFAVGLSRQLYGLTIASERPGHRMSESWHPLGVVGVISAFNFPVAVWAWNSALAFVCGNSVIWKPSEKTPVTALATQKLLERAIVRFGDAPEGLSQIIIGGREVGEALVDNPRVPLISATGSTAMGRAVAPRVAARFGRSILELGGNNAIIVAPSADLEMALRAILFGAVGTCGQRCTTTRRLFVHESVYERLIPALKAAYGKVRIGNPLESETLVGPLIDKAAFDGMERALKRARAEGGVITGGGRVAQPGDDAFYVTPAIVELKALDANVLEETFAPILYVMTYRDFEDALLRHNAVPQGLSSAIFTNDLREAEGFTAAAGSDCGIANVNIGTSGAEIGGAFGGEKETGGGRESGSDAWRGYMRRQTSTVNYSKNLPLAQGIKFDAS
ncbi:aldehyde dehydrogenase family protein [Alphaproteobacteria bacterium LMG 31809]|uniref:aldehyde dehydrogenase (NAD(+)) n=2 Tax=Govanella unica TaxID=2975056 RepID=A0A9X3TWS7_9PROT|nr:aldehyde dehydrogenase family protein [Govania unica]MDA5193183.1 aldehyde dehydrogenase family protein [Govania unica]